MRREHGFCDRPIRRPGKTCVDDPQHLRGALTPLLGHAVVGRERAAADRSPQAADSVEPVGGIFVHDDHGNESPAVSWRQKGHVDVFIANGEPCVTAVSFKDCVGPQNVVSGSRGAQKRRLRFEQNGAGVGDRGPKDRLAEGSKRRVQSERITPIALRSGGLARRLPARREQAHSKTRDIGGFAGGTPKRDLKYGVDQYNRRRR